MRTIINGKLYDTDTAEEMAFFDNGLGGTCDYWSETLYRTETGEFFLHGSGGACSPYAEYRHNDEANGQVIIPYTIEDAKEWAEVFLTQEEYKETFGEAKDDKRGDEIIKELILTCDKLIVFAEVMRKYETSPIRREFSTFAISVWVDEETLDDVLEEFVSALQYYGVIGTFELKK